MKSRIDGGKVEAYLAGYAGEQVCALQVWYEGLQGHGLMQAGEAEELAQLVAGTAGWSDAGAQRYEKYGSQQSWKRAAK